MMEVEQGSPVWEQIAKNVNLYRLQLYPETVERIMGFFSETCSVWDFCWRVDDLDIAQSAGSARRRAAFE